MQDGLQPLSFELSAYEPSPQIPHTPLLTGAFLGLLGEKIVNADP